MAAGGERTPPSPVPRPSGKAREVPATSGSARRPQVSGPKSPCARPEAANQWHRAWPGEQLELLARDHSTDRLRRRHWRSGYGPVSHGAGGPPSLTGAHPQDAAEPWSRRRPFGRTRRSRRPPTDPKEPGPSGQVVAGGPHGRVCRVQKHGTRARAGDRRRRSPPGPALRPARPRRDPGAGRPSPALRSRRTCRRRRRGPGP